MDRKYGRWVVGVLGLGALSLAGMLATLVLGGPPQATQWCLGGFILAVLGAGTLAALNEQSFVEEAERRHRFTARRVKFSPQEWNRYIEFIRSGFRVFAGIFLILGALLFAGAAFAWQSEHGSWTIGLAVAGSLCLLVMALSAWANLGVLRELRSAPGVLELGEEGFRLGSQFESWTLPGLGFEHLYEVELKDMGGLWILILQFQNGHGRSARMRTLQVPFPPSERAVALAMEEDFRAFVRKA